MHHYQHHIGDYRRDTMHLSILEHGAYRQLLDMYYLSESPIPKETEVVFRRLCAKTDDEQKAIQTVLNEFFEYNEKTGWSHKRCDCEIQKYADKAEKAKENGKLGGRPKKTEVVISGFSEKTETKANQEPRTKNQEPSIDRATPRKRGSRLQEDWQLPADWKTWALSTQTTWDDEHVQKVALSFRNYWIAKSGKDATKLDWLATWQNWVMREAALKINGAKPAEWWASEDATLKKGAEYGLSPLAGEGWPQFRNRIRERLTT